MYVAQYEKKHGIPAGLLQAISRIESGRKDSKGQIVAWPWTVNVQGKGHYFPTKEAAIVAVRKMQLQGIRSIDVGCMQINLHFHPDAFKNLNEAFEPSQNVAYGALFLAKLKKEHASWQAAVAHYHSANPAHHVIYQKNVLTAWNQDFKVENIISASAVSEPEAFLPPRIARVRRLSTSHQLSVQDRRGHLSTKATIRRVNRVSRYLKRISSRTRTLQR